MGTLRAHFFSPFESLYSRFSNFHAMTIKFIRPNLSWIGLVFLPYTLSLVWPRSYGPSLMVSPFLMGLAAVALAALVIRPHGQIRSAGWLLLVVGVISLGPWTQSLMLWSVISAALASWLTISLGHSCATKDDLMRAFIFALVLGMVVNVLIAWLQFFDQELLLYPFVSMYEGRRPYGNIRQSNHLATLCVMGLASAWWASQSGYWRNSVVVAVSVVAMSGLALSVSRVGWVEVTALAICVAFWKDEKKKLSRIVFVFSPIWVFIWSLVLKVLSAWFLTTISGFSERGTGSMLARWVYWKETWNLAIKHPTQGVGWEEFRYSRFMEEPIFAKNEIVDNAHNLILHLLANVGFASTFLILMPVVWLLFSRKPWCNSSLNVRWAWLIILSIILHSMVEYPLWYMNFIIPIALAFGIVISHEEIHPVKSKFQRSRAFAVSGAALVLLIGTAAASYDYARILPAFSEGVRAAVDSKAYVAAQKTWIFGVYTDRILAEHVKVTPENAQAMWQISERLMHTGPTPINLWTGLAARCQLGGGLQAKELAKRFEDMFPAAYLEFKQLTPAVQFSECMR